MATPAIHNAAFPAPAPAVPGLDVLHDVCAVKVFGDGGVFPTGEQAHDEYLATLTPAELNQLCMDILTRPIPVYPAISATSYGLLYWDAEYIDPRTDYGLAVHRSIARRCRADYPRRKLAAYGWPRQRHEEWDNPQSARAIRVGNDGLAGLLDAVDMVLVSQYVNDDGGAGSDPDTVRRHFMYDCAEGMRLAHRTSVPKPVAAFIQYRSVGGTTAALPDPLLEACWTVHRSFGISSVLFEWNQTFHQEFVAECEKAMRVWAGIDGSI